MARTLPTMPSWSANQEITSTLLNEITTYAQYMSSPPSFRAEQHTTQSITTGGTGQQITCDTVIHDSDSGLSAVSPYPYVVPVAGIWDLSGGVGLAANATGARLPFLTQNGTTINGAGPLAITSANTALWNVSASGVPLNVGDIIGLWIIQTSGSTLSTAPVGGQCSWFAGRLVSLQNP